MSGKETTTTKVLLQLREGVEPALNRLHAVQERRRIHTVLIKNAADENDSGWSEEEWDKRPFTRHRTIASSEFKRLFAALGRIGSLRGLIVDCHEHQIPISALSQAFQKVDDKNGRMETLNLHHVNLVGDRNDVQLFTKRLLQYSTLLTVCIKSCNTDNVDMNGLFVTALAPLSNIRNVLLEEMDISGNVLVELCHLPNLRKLQLRHIPASNQHMPMLSEVMQIRQALQHLQIRYALDKSASLAFFKMLEVNASLDTVDIDMDCWDNYGVSLAQALKSNMNLSDLEINLFGDDEHVETNAVLLAEALADNTSLKRLCLLFNTQPRHDDMEEQAASVVERWSKAYIPAFAEIMPKNTSLCELTIGPVHKRVHFRDPIQFYLKLNQAGRKELLEPNEASRQEWVDTLIEYRDDLNVLHYFLSMNPSLTDLQGTSHPKTAPDDLILEPRCKRLRLEDLSAQTMG